MASPALLHPILGLTLRVLCSNRFSPENRAVFVCQDLGQSVPVSCGPASTYQSLLNPSLHMQKSSTPTDTS